MRLMHVGLVKASEAASDLLFRDVLGLERMAEKRLSATLVRQVFGLDAECPILLYRGGEVEIEVFVSPHPELRRPHLGHLCLEVEDLAALFGRCAAAGIAVRRIPRDAAPELVFLQDEEGNLFEIKPPRVAASAAATT